MLSEELPIRDEIPWGTGTRWEKIYLKERIERLEELFLEGLFIAEKAGLPPGTNLSIDLGCGIGAHIAAFEYCGINSIGVDISSFALKYAEEIARLKNVSPSISQQDFMDLECSSQAALVTCLNNTFGLLSEHNALHLIQLISEALVPGGTFVISSDNREQIVEKLSFQIGPGKKWQEKNGIMSCTSYSFDLFGGRYNVRSEFMDMKSGEKTTEPYNSIRLYTLSEMNSLLENNGFELESVFGDYEGNDYSAISPHMIVFARKQEF